jgi:uncharacterized membrane protein YgcG
VERRIVILEGLPLMAWVRMNKAVEMQEEQADNAAIGAVMAQLQEIGAVAARELLRNALVDLVKSSKADLSTRGHKDTAMAFDNAVRCVTLAGNEGQLRVEFVTEKSRAALFPNAYGASQPLEDKWTIGFLKKLALHLRNAAPRVRAHVAQVLSDIPEDHEVARAACKEMDLLAQGQFGCGAGTVPMSARHALTAAGRKAVRDHRINRLRSLSDGGDGDGRGGLGGGGDAGGGGRSKERQGEQEQDKRAAPLPTKKKGGLGF